ncbi:protein OVEREXPRESSOR OF CATIONIC PEROXIDASE 3 [Gossypium raimondii]|uniref:Homeobox domain-containing protein n=2 Tax=Gossypium TaxID=3633 RepID=A0A0D2PJA7_GOSRA|nr:protein OVEREXPRESSOR OF CATIONIC PEROXIDASE 3 [Gossypium raimondii]KJB27043.1 hypothetical protein B456_004G274200 [Gossypium raimondii]MBA0584900.1 hypothetical protein [Gossypium raimondii]
MASALSVNSSISVRILQSSYRGRVSVAQPRYFNLLPAPQSRRRYTVAYSRRRNNQPASTEKKKRLKKEKKKGLVEKEEEDFEGDPFEALFKQLEEDLKNDNPDMEDDDDEGDEINEEDIDRLANELAEAFGDFDFEGFSSAPNDAKEEVEDDGEEDGNDDEVEERPVKLKNWQLRRLAAALKVGRRKTSIKTLAAELCLDRAVVLELLREPPPELLMISATLPDEPVKKEPEPESEPEPEPMPETKHVETLAFETTMDNVKHEPKVKEPIHVMQQRWSAQKRLKKVQIDTLEKVYRRSKRPTNTMISSIVQVTNLPRKRVVKWFEDKRNEDGVPEHRQPYRRYGSETVFSD